MLRTGIPHASRLSRISLLAPSTGSSISPRAIATTSLASYKAFPVLSFPAGTTYVRPEDEGPIEPSMVTASPGPMSLKYFEKLTEIQVSADRSA